MKNIKKLVLSLVLGTLVLGASATTLVLTSDLYQNNRKHHRNKEMTLEQILEKASTTQSELYKIRTKFYSEESIETLVDLDFTVELLFNINKENSKYENKEKLTKEEYKSFKKLLVKLIRSLKTSKTLFGEISDRDLLHNLFYNAKELVSLINNSEIVVEDEKTTSQQPEKVETGETTKEIVKNSEDNQKDESENSKLEEYKKLYSNYIKIFNYWIDKIKKNKLETELAEVLKSLTTKKEQLKDILNNKLNEVVKDENSFITNQELQSFRSAVIWHVSSKINLKEKKTTKK